MKFPDLSLFQTVSTDNWYTEAQKQLKGKDVLSEISWNSLGLKEIKPYYDKTDLKDLSEQINFFRKLPTHTWKLFERISVKDEKLANKTALNALMGGCDGVIFETKNGVNHKVLLSEIDLSICTVSINEPVEGTFGMNDSNSITDLSTSTPVNQIQNLLRMLGDSHRWIQRNSFPDFFVEIATTRALRFLLNSKKNGTDIKIHTSVSFHDSPEHQWFLNTTGGLASILGGSYSIDLPTSTGDSRVSRNVGNIIREESGIDQYEDQCGGSFFVESLTNQIIQQVRNQE